MYCDENLPSEWRLLTLTAWCSPGSIIWPREWPPAEVDVFPLAMRLCVLNQKVMASVIWSHGVARRKLVGNANLPDPLDGFVATIAGELDGGGEFWTDISLLVSCQANDQDAFGFEWLFSGSQDADPTTATQPQALQGLVEAQAR
jgi:hypothetical protein